MNTMKNKEPDYGNWVSKAMLEKLWGLTALLLAALLCAGFLWKQTIAVLLLLVLFLPTAAVSVYMQLCHHAFSFEGGGVMRNIHHHLLGKLLWNGKGELLDIGCGSGALTILCAKSWPDAVLTGIDYWGKEWSYAKEQCENNALLERVSNITFLQGDAARLPFADESFDAAVSNFVFHEVRTQPDKRKVIKEALRVVKKGGVFAFHDLFEQEKLYGNIDELLRQLESEGISELHYEAHTERLPFIPGYAKGPGMLTGLGILYGRK